MQFVRSGCPYQGRHRFKMRNVFGCEFLRRLVMDAFSLQVTNRSRMEIHGGLRYSLLFMPASLEISHGS